MATSASRTIKSAHRVLEILEYFDQDRRSVTVMEMSRALNYPQSSTSELLRCLTRLGYLHYNRFRRAYSPTARVALLGAWVKPSLFRGGPVLSAIDEVSKATDETVMLSTSSNYEVQHLHVIHGNNEGSADVHVGDTLPVLHSPQGRLLLSSYRNEHVRSAVHRLNAEEQDLDRRVNLNDVIVEFATLRDKGWLIEEIEGGMTCIAVLLPRRRNMDRLVLSIEAPTATIQARQDEILQMLIEQRDKIAEQTPEDAGCGSNDNVVRMPEPIKIMSYRRHFA